MKTLHSALYILLFSVLPIFLIGQSVPFSVNYQAIARDADGLPIVNAAIDAEILILQSGESGPEVYSETHSTMTNEFGLYLFVIGEGSTSDDLSLIDWAADNYYLKTITSIDNGDPLEAVAKLNSVPYSFVSYKSVIDNVDDADSDPENERQDLELNGTQLGISNGNTVDLSDLMSEGNITETLTSIQLDPVTNTLTYSDEGGNNNAIDLCPVIDNCETVTIIAFNNFTSELQYIDENGDTNIIPLGDLISTLEDLNDGHVIASHISGDGTVTNIEETVTEIVDNNDGTFTYTNEDGTAFTFGLAGSGIGAESLTSIQLDNNTNSLNYIDENGDANVIDLCPVIDNCETLTALAFDPALSHLVYLDEDGTTNNIDLSSLLSGGGSGSNTLTELSYDPFSNQLNYQDENGNLNIIDMGSLLSQFEDLNDGNVIASHISGDGTVTNIEETVTEIVDNNDGTFTYTNEDGTAFTFGLAGSGIGAESLTSIQLDNNTNSLNYIDENGDANVIDLCPVIDNCETLTALAFDPALSHLVYLDEDGTTNNIDLSSLLSGGGSGSNTLTELSYDPFSNQLNYQDENGNLNVIDMGSLVSHFTDLNDGHIIGTHTSGDGTVADIEETISTLVDNGDGTLTYTNEDGTSTTFTGESTGTNTGGGSGNELTVLTYSPLTNQLEYIDENGDTNIIDLGDIVSTFTDLNDGNVIATHTSGDGTVTQIEETLTTIADNEDGTFSYTSEDGTNITFDTQYERDVYMSLVGNNPVDQSPLHYVALAGPEAAAYERGESTLSNGEFFVAYSDHFKQTINTATVTVQVTPYSADTYGLAVTQRTADGFLVKELKGGTSNFTFSWEVKAVRKGLENLSISN